MATPLLVAAACSGAFTARPLTNVVPLSHQAARMAVATPVLDPNARPLARGAKIVMFDGPPPEDPDDMDAWEELVSELTPLQKQLKKLNPLFFGGAVNTVTVLSALVAWLVTPPMGKVAAVGSLAGGGWAGRRMGKKMREARRGLVPSAVADMVKKNGIGGLKPKDVARLAERFDVDPVEFEQQLSSVYALYLRQLLSEGEGKASPADVRELGALRRGIGLRWNATEAVHTAEATAFLDGEAPPSSLDELPAELAALLWTSEALYVTSKGKASTASLRGVLGADEASAQRLINGLSKPIYRRAVAQAVGKYNSTEAPEVLATARTALCLTEAAASQVHAAVYDAQLAVLLDADGEAAVLGEEEMELLGELEGMLQVRGAESALRRKTEPLYQLEAERAAQLAFADDAEARNPVAMWGKLAVRQQQLKLSTETAKSQLIYESRKLAAQKLAEAAEQLAAGREATALAEVARVADYARYLGEVLAVTGQYAADASPADLASRYMGALGVGGDEDSKVSKEEAAALAAAVAAADTLDPALADVTEALFSLCDPALAEAREKYASALESTVSSNDFGAAETRKHAEVAGSLGVSPALAQRLATEAYYGYLIDASERGDRKALEEAAAVRECFAMDSACVIELYETTEVDELVISAVADLEERPLSVAAINGLGYIERQLEARPGVVASVVAAASSND